MGGKRNVPVRISDDHHFFSMGLELEGAVQDLSACSLDLGPDLVRCPVFGLRSEAARGQCVIHILACWKLNELEADACVLGGWVGGWVGESVAKRPEANRQPIDFFDRLGVGRARGRRPCFGWVGWMSC